MTVTNTQREQKTKNSIHSSKKESRITTSLLSGLIDFGNRI